jgi:hypothetical protein
VGRARFNKPSSELLLVPYLLEIIGFFKRGAKIKNGTRGVFGCHKIFKLMNWINETYPNQKETLEK